MEAREKAREIAEELRLDVVGLQKAPAFQERAIDLITAALLEASKPKWVSVGIDWEPPAELTQADELEFVTANGARKLGRYWPDCQRFIDEQDGWHKPMYVSWYRKVTPLPAAPQGGE